VLLLTLSFALLTLGVAPFFAQAAPVPDECMTPTTSTNAGRTISVSSGTVFGIVLDANPTTGYSWSITAQPDPSVVVAVDSQFIPPSTALPGAPGRECFRFQAAGAGQTNIGFAYARPFEPDAPPAQTAEVQVSVSTPQPSSAAPGDARPRVPVQIPAQ
jgi:inhibitor of cysteine peptidase